MRTKNQVVKKKLSNMADCEDIFGQIPVGSGFAHSPNSIFTFLQYCNLLSRAQGGRKIKLKLTPPPTTFTIIVSQKVVTSG